MHRLWAPALLVVGLGSAAVVAYQQRGLSPQKLQVGAGTAWLSGGDGTASLIDGSTGARLARVVVAPPAEAASLEIVNDRDGAFVVNRARGTVLRLDSRTLSRGDSAFTFSDPGDQGLQVLADNGRAFVVSGSRQTITAVDSGTLGVMDAPETYRGDTTQLMLTSSGVVWGLDPSAKGLVRYDGSGAVRRTDWTGDVNALRLLAADGNPAAVDLSKPQAVQFDAGSAKTKKRACLDIPTSGGVSVGGSADAPLIAGLGLSANLLVIANLAKGTCSRPIALDGTGQLHRYGAPTLLGGTVYVPDLTMGEIVVVDLSRSRAPIRVPVGGAPNGLVLFTANDLLWFDVVGTATAGSLTRGYAVVTTTKTDTTPPPQAPPEEARPVSITTTAVPTTAGGSSHQPAGGGTTATGGGSGSGQSGGGSSGGSQGGGSGGPPKACVVISVTGRTEGDARNALPNCAVTVINSNVAPYNDTVIGQNPPSGTLAAGAPVTITVAVGPAPPQLHCVVAPVTGKTEGDARNALPNCSVTVVTANVAPYNNSVIAQNPTSGTLAVGAPVTITVAVGPPPPPCVVAPVKGMTETNARKALSNCTVTVLTTNVPPYDYTVSTQSPASGTLPNGAAVSITLAVPPLPQVTVPNLVGQTSSNAAATLSALGLHSQVKMFGLVCASQFHRGAIDGQDPVAGASVLWGSTVTLSMPSGIISKPC
jgi:beta-lactam-binding protein with PASTA domain